MAKGSKLSISKKGSGVFAVIMAAISLTGCQNDTPPAPEITSGIEDGTKHDISQSVETDDISIGEVTDSGEEVFIPRLLMDTDKPFVLAEDKYIIEKRDIDVSTFNEYGHTEYMNDGKFYYSRSASFEHSDSKAEIFAFDYKSGERITLYSEIPKERGIIDLYIEAVYGAYLYFYRTETAAVTETPPFQILGRDLYRIDLRDNTAEKIFSYMDEEVLPIMDKEAIPTYSLAKSGDILFIPAVHEALNDYRFVIFQYDMNTGQASLFRDNADYPVPYNNGIVYFHDGGFYYHGEASDIKGQGVFYDGDELIFSSDFDGSREDIVSDFDLDALIYTCADDTENFIAAGSDFGIFDRNFKKVLIAHTEKKTWIITPGGISKTGLVAIHAPKPMIYDVNEECFAVIPIDDYYFYHAFVTDTGVCFLAYEYGNDYDYVSAALYTVKRR